MFLRSGENEDLGKEISVFRGNHVRRKTRVGEKTFRGTRFGHKLLLGETVSGNPFRKNVPGKPVPETTRRGRAGRGTNLAVGRGGDGGAGSGSKFLGHSILQRESFNNCIFEK